MDDDEVGRDDDGIGEESLADNFEFVEVGGVVMLVAGGFWPSLGSLPSIVVSVGMEDVSFVDSLGKGTGDRGVDTDVDGIVDNDGDVDASDCDMDGGSV